MDVGLLDVIQLVGLLWFMDNWVDSWYIFLWGSGPIGLALIADHGFRSHFSTAVVYITCF